jgi:hypothetical protein
VTDRLERGVQGTIEVACTADAMDELIPTEMLQQPRTHECISLCPEHRMLLVFFGENVLGGYWKT